MNRSNDEKTVRDLHHFPPWGSWEDQARTIGTCIELFWPPAVMLRIMVLFSFRPT